VAVASAGPYASLHLTPDNHASTPLLSFLQAGCPSCHPTNSVKALKAHSLCAVIINKSRTSPEQNGIVSATRVLVLSYLPLCCTIAMSLILRLCPNFSIQSWHPFWRRKNCFQVEYWLCWNVSRVVIVEHLSKD